MLALSHGPLLVERSAVAAVAAAAAAAPAPASWNCLSHLASYVIVTDHAASADIALPYAGGALAGNYGLAPLAAA